MVPAMVDRDVAGFVENRILYAIMREALHLLDEGVASAEAIDTITKWGIGYKLAVIGPLELLDMAGLDIYTSVASYLNKAPQRLAGRQPDGDRQGRRGQAGHQDPGRALRLHPGANPATAAAARPQARRHAQGARRRVSRSGWENSNACIDEAWARHAVPTPRRHGYALSLLGIAALAWQLGVASGLPAPALRSRTPERIVRRRAPVARGDRRAPRRSRHRHPGRHDRRPDASRGRPRLRRNRGRHRDRRPARGSPARTPASPSAPGRSSATATSIASSSRQGAARGLRSLPSTPEPMADGGAELLAISAASVSCRTGASGRRSSSLPVRADAEDVLLLLHEVDGRLLIDGILGEISFSVP